MPLRVMTLNRGEQSLIVTPANQMSYLHCIEGSARVFSRRCGVGWHLCEGEHFVLRSGASYSIAANEPIKVALHNDAGGENCFATTGRHHNHDRTNA